MKEQILDRLARLLKYFKGLEHENNEKEYAYILKGTINGITYSIKNVEDFFENSDKEDSNKKYLYASAKNLQISQYLQHFLDANHLKPGEHFYLTNKNGERVFEKSTFEIGCDGIFSIHNTPTSIDIYELFYRLMSGEYLVEKLPFKPKFNTVYWYLAANGCYCSKCFIGDTQDLLLMWAGLCYKTKEDAIANKEKTIKIWESTKDEV